MHALGGVYDGLLDLDALDKREGCCTIHYLEVSNICSSHMDSSVAGRAVCAP
jgi:hypothetical protein